MSINKISMCLNNLSDEAYELKVQFSQNSTKSFIFIKERVGIEKEIIDLYSLNCNCSTDLSGVFTGKDTKCLKQIVKQLDLSHPTLFTLDMKDIEKGYLDEKIVKGEKSVCEFFSSEIKTLSKSAKQAKKYLENKLDYIYCEGSLKRELLQKFEEREIEYLNSEQGVQDYCRLTEVFMNAAKFGHTYREIDAAKFIYATKKAFQPHHRSTVWYPELYKKSVHDVVSLFNPLFQTASSYDESTGITALTMEMRV